MATYELPARLRSLVEVLRNHPDFTCRMDAAEKLGESADARTVSYLVDALDDANPNVTNSAAYALLQLGDPAAVPALASVLSDPSRGELLRLAAVDILGDFAGSLEAVLALVSAVMNDLCELNPTQLCTILQSNEVTNPQAPLGVRALDALARSDPALLSSHLNETMSPALRLQLARVLEAVRDYKRGSFV